MIRLEVPFYATLSLCAGPIVFARGFRDLRTRRLIQNTPTARIRSMAMGLVEVSGTVLERSVILAPFTGHECAYWEVDIAVRTRRDSWTVVHRKSSGNPFFVSDGTGVALVYPQGSQCRTPSPCEEVCPGHSLPECYERYMLEQGLWLRHAWKLSALRFRERTLEEGQRVFILGSAEPRTPAIDVSSPVEAATADGSVPWLEPELAATGTEPAPLRRLAAGPGASHIVPAARPTAVLPQAPPLPDAARWRARAVYATTPHVSDAPRAGVARPAAIPPRGPGRVQALHDRISAVIRRGTNESTFLISAESETAVETSLELSTLGKLFAGPVLTALGLAFWLYSLSAHHLTK